MKEKIVLLFCLLCAGAFTPLSAHSVTETSDAYLIEHKWTFKETQWTCHFEIGKDVYHYYKDERTHLSDSFLRYILSDYDRGYIRDIVRTLRESGDKTGYSDSDNVKNVVAFVQSLTYMTDKESTGQKDYVRYPIETLVDGGGDCEDTSVLIAAILYEMGYGELLVLLPNHMALAIRGDDNVGGTYYVYDKEKYYYLETTNSGWELGDIPEQYKKAKVEIVPVEILPEVYLMSYELNSADYNDQSMSFNITCNIENTGPSTARNMKLYVRACSNDMSRTYAEKVIDLGDFKEPQKGKIDVSLRVPRRRKMKFEMVVSGDNFKSKSLCSKLLDVQ